MLRREQVLAILADVKEHPDEDGLRLILADWLEEFGDASDAARAELIRCQITHERAPPGDAEKTAAGRRARWLQQNHGTKWLGPLAQWLSAWAFRRGLLSVSFEASLLRGQGLALLGASETWAWVDETYLLGAADADVARLRKCELFDTVGSLGFRRSPLGPDGVAALGDSPLAARLHKLDLSQCPVGNRGVEVLAHSPGFAGLRHLDLSGCQLTNRADLRASTSLPELRTLTLWGNNLGPEPMRRLAASAGWPCLCRLDLRACQIDDVGGRALARWAGLASLRELDLSDNNLGEFAATALAESPHLDAIEALTLWGNPLGEAAARLRGRFGRRVHLAGVG